METLDPTTPIVTPAAPVADANPGDRPAVAARWIPWLLIAVTAVTFGRVVTHDFAPFDDEQTIRDNPRLNPARLTRDGVLWYWDNPAMSLYAPVTYTVWGVVAQVSRVPAEEAGAFKLEARNFHAVSLVLHVASVLLVYAILRRLLGRAWPAAAGALLYGLHPLQVEAVAWASGMKDVLSGCLSLAAIWLYLPAVAPSPSPLLASGNAEPDALARIHAPRYTLALACFALAMLAKPAAMVTPLLLAVIDYALLRRPPERIVRSLAPWLALAIPVAVIAKLAQPAYDVPAVELWQRPVVAGASLAFYLQKLVLPMGLAFEYGWRPAVMLQKGWFYAIAAIPLALGAILWLTRRRFPLLGTAALLFLVPLLPVLGFVPFSYQVHSTVGDHYLYLAMLGPALAVAWALGRLDPRRWSRAAALSGVLAGALGICSFAQLRYWQNEESVLHRTLAVNPSSALGQNNLGQVYARNGDIDPALHAFRTAADSNPDFRPARMNLFILYEALGRADDAIREFYELRRINELLPENARTEFPTDVLFKAGQRAARQHRYDVAARYFEEAALVRPEDPRPRAALQQARDILKAASTRPTSR